MSESKPGTAAGPRNCEYCHKPVELNNNYCWHSDADNVKVWHEVCSYQEEIERLTAALNAAERSATPPLGTHPADALIAEAIEAATLPVEGAPLRDAAARAAAFGVAYADGCTTEAWDDGYFTEGIYDAVLNPDSTEADVKAPPVEAEAPRYGPGTQDEIEHLAGQVTELLADNRRLREALQRLINVCKQPDIYPHVRGHVALAEAALAHPAPDSPSGEAALIAKWRAADSASFDPFVGGAFRRCADELEALLAAPRTEKW